MAELTLPQAVDRLKGNESRIQDFVNGNANNYYVTSGGVQVETLPSLQTRLAAAISAAAATRADLAKPGGSSLVGHGASNVAATLDTHSASIQSASDKAAKALPMSGGRMSGPLYLASSPTSSDEAVPKSYADALGIMSGYQELTQSGQFNKPAGARWIYVELVGAGASGTAYSGTDTRSVEGGPGGDFTFKLFRAADVPQTVNVTIGSGGSPVTASASGTTGNPGGSTSFGSLISALGGESPVNWSTNPNAITDARVGGMKGGKRGSSMKGGGAGFSALGGSSLNTWAPAGSSQEAGKGGERGQTGEYPGGGGGCGVSSSGSVTSGAGANGRARIWWW